MQLELHIEYSMWEKQLELQQVKTVIKKTNQESDDHVYASTWQAILSFTM